MLLSCFLQQADSSFYVPTPISLCFKTKYISKRFLWLCFAFGSPIASVVYSHQTSNCFAIVRRKKKQVQSKTTKTTKISSRFKVTQHKRESRKRKKKYNSRRSWKRSWKKSFAILLSSSVSTHKFSALENSNGVNSIHSSSILNAK